MFLLNRGSHLSRVRYCTLVRFLLHVWSPARRILLLCSPIARIRTNLKCLGRWLLCRLQNVRVGGMRDGTLAAATTCSKAPWLAFQRTHLPRFGAWDGESVCGHGVLPPAASKEPQLALSHSVKDLLRMISVVLGPLERVVGTGWTWLHALMMTKKKKA
jgi:hypothetical protein